MKEWLSFTGKSWFWMGLAFLLYMNTLNHGYVIDDQIAITRNSLTQKGISGIGEIFSHSYLFGYDGREDESYRPLTLTTFALEKSLFDASPKASHFIQVLLYGILLVVLFKWLTELVGEQSKALVTIACLLFAVHPVHTEVVANVKSRDELLGALLLFTSLMFFVRWLRERNMFQIILSLFTFFLAMLSKETAVLGIVLFPAMSFIIEKRSLKQTAQDSLPLISPFVLYFAIRTTVLSDVLITDPIDPVANSLALAKSGSELLATNFSIFFKYLELLIYPIRLSWDYSVPQIPLVGFSSISALTGVLILFLLIVVLIIGVWKRTMIGLGALIFFSTFALTSNFFFLINCPLGERFLFMPSLGFLIVIVWSSERIMKERWMSYASFLVLPVALLFSLRTLYRNMDWKENLTIYESGRSVCPRSVKVRFNLGTEYLQQGERAQTSEEKMGWFSKALYEFDASEQLYPDYSLIYENSGFVYSEMGKLAGTNKKKLEYYYKGLAELRKAIDSLGYQKPNLYQNTFFILEQLIQTDSTRSVAWKKEIIKKASKKKEKNQDDYLRICIHSRDLKEDSTAVKYAIKLAGIYPDKAAFQLELAEHYFKTGDFSLSLKLVSSYVAANPNDLSAKSNKGMLLEILGRKKEALSIYEEILKTDPSQSHTRGLYEKLKISI
ncbi:MAG: tetratricopeptide repeat protein [Cryomorphaceae bacterium]|jgi:tetratricopeptide (TPR) repeat protein|nr:tetratricopeptide repeat protein [Cryomorphaceae bacterium]